MKDVFLNFVLPVLRVSTPLIFAALGGLWCERSGIIQIGLEGYILTGSFVAALAALHFHNPFLGMLAGGLAGVAMSLIYALSVLRFRANQIVAGTAMNLLALGITPFLSKLIFDSTGSTPPLPIDSQFQSAPLWIALAVILLSQYVYQETKFGLQLRFAGEHPGSLSTAGVSVQKMRVIGISLSGFLAGLGGATLSTYLSSSFIRNMSAGRGFIALAAVILGKWKPIPTVFACLFFGLTEQAQIRLQGVVLWGAEPVPVQWIQILPYLITLIVLAGAVGRSRSPKALGQLLSIFCVIIFTAGCFKPKTLPAIVKDEMSSVTETKRPSAGELAKGNLELLSELMRVTFNDDHVEDKDDFGGLVSSLNQGASLEGIYRGIVMGSRYRGMESHAQAAHPSELKAFATEMAELQDDMKNPSEFADDEAKKSPVIEYPDGKASLPAPGRAGQEVRKKNPKTEVRDHLLSTFIGASSLTLKRVLADEALKKIDEMKDNSGELSQWYARFVMRMCDAHVDFGLKQRNDPNFDFHFKFAQKMALDRVKWEVLNRYHRYLNARSTL